MRDVQEPQIGPSRKGQALNNGIISSFEDKNIKNVVI